jgi:DNA polymerase-3 subunit alpha
MNPAFVHLQLHTEFSLANSVVRIPALMQRAVELGMPAVAMTDQNNLFGLVKFYQAARKHGIKPIVGADLLVWEPEDPAKPSRLLLLCQDYENGYRNLSRLLTRAYLEGQHHGVPMLEREWFEGLSGGLIALSGGKRGDVGRALLARREEDALQALKFWQGLFPDRYYMEVSRTGREGDETYLHAAVKLAANMDVPLVATNDVRFLDQDEFESHEARVCIHGGHTLTDPGRPKDFSPQQYLRSAREMTELFEDLPEALANSVEIAQRCNLKMQLGHSVLPEFEVPAGYTTASWLAQASQQGLERKLRLRKIAEADVTGYRERLAIELEVIAGMGFPGYFLIVADFIRWARENDVPVGPGRGSGAGSLVAWVLGITDLDPLEHDLLFERFLNPERVSMPDFDVDFCMEGRDRVIEYVAERYGRDQVSQIITFGTMAAKAVVRDVGRVLGHPYGFVDRIAKLIPFEIGMTLDKALVQEKELRTAYDSEEDVQALIDLARSLEGLSRNAGKHAGGVVIAPGPLTDFVPLYCEEGGSNVISQFDKDDVEKVGLVKFDFLGLRTLTIIDWALKAINHRRQATGEEPVTLDGIQYDDPETFALLKRCETTAVFQLESRGMKDLIKRLQPDRFDEIVALVALFRPGPLQSGMVDDFIDRKHDRTGATIDYLHSDLQSILQPTYGVILYQEQVMQIAQVLAGYSLGSADLLRRAMGKKNAEEMAKQREIFVGGAKNRGVDEAKATYIFDLMEKFAGYGFNKSHSAAYAMLSYQTAWLKAHYPAMFMAAVLSSDMDSTDKVVTFIEECKRMGLAVLPPDVNASQFAFSAPDPKSIRYGLGAIKGVGRGAIEGLLEERDRNGLFTDLFDLCCRADMKRLNRRVLEAVIRSGSMDSLGANRATLLANLDEALKVAEQDARASAAGQSDLFGSVTAPVLPMEHTLIKPRPEWSEQQRLLGERETLGLYLTGHPINEYEEELKQFTSGRIADLVAGKPGPGESRHASNRKSVTVGGLVMDMRKRGNRLILVLDDRSARLEVTLFDDVANEHRHLLDKDAILIVEGNLRFDDFMDDWRLNASTLVTMEQARQRYARRLLIQCDKSSIDQNFAEELKSALQPNLDGLCDVWIQYRGRSAQGRVCLGDQWRVKPTRDLIDRLAELAGRDRVRVLYPRRIEST